MENYLMKEIASDDADCLRDESRLAGRAVSISYPENEEQVSEILAYCARNKISVTTQGSRTGVNGACVPLRGHVLSLEKMKGVTGFTPLSLTLESGLTAYGKITAEAGVTLAELDQKILSASKDGTLCFPVSPTESTATIGGVIATGANGPRGYFYGEPQDYIESLRTLTIDGKQLALSREDPLLDAILGSEGQYGIILSATLYLTRKPACVWGILFFFKDDRDACAFADDIDEEIKADAEASILTLEYMDSAVMNMIEKQKSGMESISSLPAPPADAAGAIYVEIGADDEERILETAERLMVKALEHNSDPDLAWAMSDDYGVKALRNYRHAASESVNNLVSESNRSEPRITKLSSDVVFRDLSRLETLEKYKEECSANGLSFCVFGPIGNKHLYVNILARDYSDYLKGKEQIGKWIREASVIDGRTWRNHGVGKIKNRDYSASLDMETRQRYLALKNKMDPDGLLNPGNGISDPT